MTYIYTKNITRDAISCSLTDFCLQLQMESSAQEIHENLNAVIDYQTHHRLRETQGRHRAEELNERIMIWSVFVTVAIFSVGFGQVRG